MTAPARAVVSCGLGVVVLAAGGTPATPVVAHAAPLEGTVRIATTGDQAELRETIPISRHQRAKPRVAMSLSPSRMPRLRQGDRLEITAELQTTNSCYHAGGSHCVARPYRFTPRIGTQLVLADGKQATHGPGTMAITSRREGKCSQRVPEREHHCVWVFKGSGLRLDDPAALPCELARCRVNLVVDAHHRDARRGNKLLLGIDRADGSVRQDRGRINVARFRGPPLEPRVFDTQRRLHRSVDVERRKKVAIYSLRLPNLRRGDQLTVGALAITSIGHLPYGTFIGSQLILARRPEAVRPTPFTREVSSHQGEVSEGNGFNCTQLTTPCRSPRVGTLVMRRTPRRGGEVVPLYVNFVLRNAPKRADDQPGDRVRIRAGGGIAANRYR